MARKPKAVEAPTEKKANQMLQPYTDNIAQAVDAIHEQLQLIKAEADQVAAFDTDTKDLQDEITALEKKVEDLNEEKDALIHPDDLTKELIARCDAQELVFFGASPVLCVPQNTFDNHILEALAKLSRVHQPAQLLNLFERLADPAFASNLSRFIDSYDLLY